MRRLEKILREYLQIAVGAFLVAFGVEGFLVPSMISTGGVSGLGTVLYYSFGVPMAVTVFLANLILFFFGFRVLRRSAIYRTVFGILLLSAFLAMLEGRFSFGEDMLLSAIFGGVLVGAGVGLTVLKDASTGGSDFLAMMLQRSAPHISVAGFMLVIDAAVIALSGIVFRDYTVTLYSAIALYISTRVADFLLVRGEYAKSVLVVSEHAQKIADVIMRDMARGVTGLYSRGLYEGKDGLTLMCILRSREIPRLLSIVKQIDGRAFTVISEVRQVVGTGFETE